MFSPTFFQGTYFHPTFSSTSLGELSLYFLNGRHDVQYVIVTCPFGDITDLLSKHKINGTLILLAVSIVVAKTGTGVALDLRLVTS